MDVLLWALGILVAIQTAIVGFLAKAMWSHVTECREFRAEVAAMGADVKRVKEDIGSHETGLRGSVHELKNRVTPVVLWFERERR